MLLAYRLVRLIETHSDALASGLLKKVQSSEFTPTYGKVPAEELRDRVYEIYRHLGAWLLGNSDVDMERRYREIGRRRYQQGVPLSELIWAITLTNENLWEFLKQETALDRPVEVFSEMQVLELLEQFFDRATYYAAQGYEQACSAQGARETSAAR